MTISQERSLYRSNGAKSNSNKDPELARPMESGHSQSSVSASAQKSSDRARSGKRKIDLSQRLRGLPVFQGCSEAFIHQLVNSGTEFRLGPEAFLTREGSPCECLYVLLRGTISISIDEMDIEALSVEPLGQAMSIGNMTLLGIISHAQSTIQVLSASSFFQITRTDFQRQLKEDFPVESQKFQGLREEHESKEYAFAGTLENRIPLFDTFADNTLRVLDAVTIRAMYFPGQVMLEEGQPGVELLMLVHGHVSVEIGGSEVCKKAVDVCTSQRRNPGWRLGLVCSTAVSVFGDLCMLGVRETRTATVKALSVCQVRVLYRSLFLRTVNEMNEVILVNSEVTEQSGFAGSELEALRRIKIFKASQCGDDFLRFLTEHLEDRVYLEGQTIIKEDDEGDSCLFVVVRGTVEVWKKLRGRLGEMVPGDAFGEMFAFGIVKRRTTTIVAKTPCLLRALHQRVLMRALEIFPDERQRILYQLLKSGELPSDAKDQMTASSGAESDRAMLQQLLADSHLFRNLPPTFLESLAESAEVRIYIPGEIVVKEGDEGDSMFVVIWGTVSVFQDPRKLAEANRSIAVIRSIRDGLVRTPKRLESEQGELIQVATMQKGSLFGEFAALGINETRNATIQSDQLSMMWNISKEQILEKLIEFPEARANFSATVLHRLEPLVIPKILGLSIFANFSERFRKMVSADVEKSLFFPGQEVVREGEPGNRMLVINIGLAFLVRKSVNVRPFGQGSHFGALLMLGLEHTYCGTLAAAQTTHVLYISRRQYKLSLDVNAQAHASRQLLIQERKEHEAFMKSIASDYIRKRMWNNSFDCQADFQEDVKAVFVNWREYTQQRCRNRRHLLQVEERRSKTTKHWLENRAEALEKVKAKREAAVAPLGAVDRRLAVELAKLQIQPKGEKGAVVPAPPPASARCPRPRQLASLGSPTTSSSMTPGVGTAARGSPTSSSSMTPGVGTAAAAGDSGTGTVTGDSTPSTTLGNCSAGTPPQRTGSSTPGFLRELSFREESSVSKATSFGGISEIFLSEGDMAGQRRTSPTTSKDSAYSPTEVSIRAFGGTRRGLSSPRSTNSDLRVVSPATFAAYMAVPLEVQRSGQRMQIAPLHSRMTASIPCSSSLVVLGKEQPPSNEPGAVSPTSPHLAAAEEDVGEVRQHGDEVHRQHFAIVDGPPPVSLQTAWPSPKTSKYQDLKVWKVLQDHQQPLDQPGESPRLPVLQPHVAGCE